MKSNSRFGLLLTFVVFAVLLISMVGEDHAVSAPLNAISLTQVLSPLEDVTLELDDGEAESSIGWDPTGETSNGNVYLPVIMKDWPPIPQTPIISPINNPNGSNDYTVSWSTAYLATSYILEEDDNLAFSSPTPNYPGNSTSWQAMDKPAGTYYYRVKGHNSWGDSSWSNVEGTTVVPPPPPQSTVYVTNDTGCELCYEVQGTGIGRKCFSSGRNLYGSFPVGTYTWSASACCGSTSKPDYFSEGIREEKFWCGPAQPAQENSSALQCEQR